MFYCLLLAMIFCHFVPLSQILVDLLVVVQVLRLCAPVRQSGYASFVDFFESLALLAVMMSLFSVFWRRFLQLHLVVVYCSEVRLMPLLSLRHFVIIGSLWLLGLPPHHCQRGLLCVFAEMFVSRFKGCVHPHKKKRPRTWDNNSISEIVAFFCLWSVGYPLQFASGPQHHCVVCVAA